MSEVARGEKDLQRRGPLCSRAPKESTKHGNSETIRNACLNNSHPTEPHLISNSHPDNSYPITTSNLTHPPFSTIDHRDIESWDEVLPHTPGNGCQ